MKKVGWLVRSLAAMVMTAGAAARPVAAAEGDGSGLYFPYPVPTAFAPHTYQLTNQGNGGSGGSLSIRRDPESGSVFMLVAEGQADIYYYDFNMTTGTVILSVNHPGGPTVLQGRRGQEVIGFTQAVLLLQQRADLLRDGITSPTQNQAPDPTAKPVADYLDAFVRTELNGGLAGNGLPFCPLAYSWGDHYACGDYMCAKTDYTYRTPCVVSKR